MKKSLRLVVLFSAFLMLLATYVPADSGNNHVYDGKTLRKIQELAKEVEFVEYTLYYRWMEILKWTSDQAQPVFSGMPPGNYSLQAEKIIKGKPAFVAGVGFDLPLPEGSNIIKLIYFLNGCINTNFSLSGMPDGFGHGNSYEVTFVDKDQSTWRGIGIYDQTSNTLRVSICLDVMRQYEFGFVKNSFGEIITFSVDELDPFKINFGDNSDDPPVVPFLPIIFIGDPPEITEQYDHEQWLRNGVQEKISEAGFVLEYRIVVKPGEELRIRTDGTGNGNDIGDTPTRITGPNGEVFTDHPNYRPDLLGGWIDDAHDYGGSGTYEDIQFIVPEYPEPEYSAENNTYTITISVRGFYGHIGDVKTRADNPENY